MSLPLHLQEIQEHIKSIALAQGLDPFETIYEMVDYQKMNEVAAYEGFPTRYPHWRFGMEYERLKKSYTWGLHKIYELVINNDPCYAFLLEGNSLVEQKMVMAHVYGHSDFFKNNLWFANTNRRMMDEMANHGSRIRSYRARYGVQPVEEFLDICLSLDNLIDPHSSFIHRKGGGPQNMPTDADIPKMPSKAYMDSYVNPAEFMDAQKKRMEEDTVRSRKIPENPQKDVLLFMLEHAPMEPWQRNILSIIREEAFYFAPQAQTKILNEGWASYWHSKLMTEHILTDAEVIDFANCHAGTVAMNPGGINPYKLGIELFRDIEERWNTGRYGKEYEDCDNMVQKLNWDRQLGKGREKIFEVRRIYNDITFLDAFLTPEFCWEHKLFTFEYNKKNSQFEVFSRDFNDIKQKLIFQLTNFGQPFIYVEDANHANRNELVLWHRHEGVDLKKDYAVEVLANLQKLWTRPVHIRTMVDDKPVLWSHNGEEFSEDAWTPQE